VSEPRLSAATKALLRAAREDGPNAAARAKVWSAVSGTVGGVAGASSAAAGTGAAGSAAASSVALAGGTSAAKMLVMGTLLGGAVTVGLATVLLRIGPAPSVPPAHSAAPVAAAAAPPRAAAALPVVDEPREPEVLSDTAPAVPLATPAVAAPSPAPSFATASRPALRSAAAANPVHAGPVAVPSDDVLLAQETALVVEARAALARGDAQGALRGIRAARALPSHRLAPEELSVEAQALRAIGREDEARDADAILRKQFPESALGR